MDQEQLTQLVNKGFTLRQIGETTGVHWQSVRYWLRKYGLKTHRICYCLTCGETNPERFKARQKKHTICRACIAHRASQRARGKKILAVEYKGGKCERCGYSKCYAALDFHHRDPNEKDPNWVKIRLWPLEKIKTELDKCDLVCSNCHREIHEIDRENKKFRRKTGERTVYDLCLGLPEP